MRSVSSGPPGTPVTQPPTSSSNPLSRGTNTTPGFVQNCPTPRVNEPTRPCASVSPRAASAAAADDDRVHAAELAVERDRVGAAGREVEQCAAAAERAGEARGLDDGMLHQRVAGLAALDERERAGGRPRGLERLGDDRGGALARAAGGRSGP